MSVRTDMRRLSVVMAVAALDTYMHRLILERMYDHDVLPGGLAKLDIRFDALLEQADETGRAARRAPYNPRPRVGIKRQLRDRLLRETFQTYIRVGDALAMAGQKKKWSDIGQSMNPTMTPDEIRDRLNGIVMRRNQIVHEGDYERKEKPRTSTRNKLTPTDAAADIDFISQLVDAIHDVVT